MNEDRREAQHWADEWQIKQKKRKRLIVFLVILAIAAVGVVNHYVSIFLSRSLYGSAEEMKAALQGRYETDYAEDIEINGDIITLTYYNESHYDLEYAEKYGYSDYEDSVYEDTVSEWSYRTGEIKGTWMDTIKVDKDGNLVYYSQVYKKTDAPKPTPIDPSELSLFKQGYDSAQDDSEAAGSEAEAETEEELLSEEALQSEESRLETEAAADSAGVEALAGGTTED